MAAFPLPQQSPGVPSKWMNAAVSWPFFEVGRPDSSWGTPLNRLRFFVRSQAVLTQVSVEFHVTKFAVGFDIRFLIRRVDPAEPHVRSQKACPAGRPPESSAYLTHRNDSAQPSQAPRR